MDSIEQSSSSADSAPFDERGPAFIFNPRRNILLGLLGSGLMLIGVFLPIFGGVNYVHNGRIDGLFVFFIKPIDSVHSAEWRRHRFY